MASLGIVDVAACHDAERSRGEDFGARTQVPHVPDLDQLLLGDLQVIVNLTPPEEHAEVTRRAIRAGMSVYSEKPLAMEVDDAAALLSEAAQAGVLVGCAPDTFLGPALQAARRAVDTGDIGTPVAASAAMLQPGPERWHPDPERFYRRGIGPVVDMGPYYLTALVALLGPVRRVAGAHAARVPERIISAGVRSGERFESEVATHVAAVLEFVGGQSATVVTSFDAQGTRTPHIELHGTEGTLVLPDPNFFDGPVWLRTRAAEWREVRCRDDERVGRGMGVADLVEALVRGSPQRASGRLGLHILEVIRAIEQACRADQAVVIRHHCAPPG